MLRRDPRCHSTGRRWPRRRGLRRLVWRLGRGPGSKRRRRRCGRGSRRRRWRRLGPGWSGRGNVGQVQLRGLRRRGRVQGVLLHGVASRRQHAHPPQARRQEERLAAPADSEPQPVVLEEAGDRLAPCRDQLVPVVQVLGPSELHARELRGHTHEELRLGARGERLWASSAPRPIDGRLRRRRPAAPPRPAGRRFGLRLRVREQLVEGTRNISVAEASWSCAAHINGTPHAYDGPCDGITVK